MSGLQITAALTVMNSGVPHGYILGPKQFYL